MSTADPKMLGDYMRAINRTLFIVGLSGSAHQRRKELRKWRRHPFLDIRVIHGRPTHARVFAREVRHG